MLSWSYFRIYPYYNLVFVALHSSYISWSCFFQYFQKIRSYLGTLKSSLNKKNIYILKAAQSSRVFVSAYWCFSICCIKIWCHYCSNRAWSWRPEEWPCCIMNGYRLYFSCLLLLLRQMLHSVGVTRPDREVSLLWLLNALWGRNVVCNRTAACTNRQRPRGSCSSAIMNSNGSTRKLSTKKNEMTQAYQSTEKYRQRNFFLIWFLFL